MKKILLLLFTASTLISCSIDDDGPQIVSAPAEVTAIEVPAFFEVNKNYDIEVTYKLPNECHMPAGINAQRAAAMGNGRRDIYIWGVATIELGNQCQEEPELETKETNPLEKKGSFQILIDEDEPYTFYLWAGLDEEGKDTFTEVVVPVGQPQPEEQQ